MGLLASTLAGAATGLGAVGVFFMRTISARLEDMILSLAAGIMLAASVFSLIIPALTIAQEGGMNEVPAALLVALAIVVGAVVITLIDRVVPHEHFVVGRQGVSAQRLARVWLFVIAITLHNVPEGMAVGVSYLGQHANPGHAMALGIGLQNVPEGLAVAGALLAVGYTRTQAFLLALGTGLLEGVGGLMAVGLAALVGSALPFVLGLSAGAMLFVISDEIIPETHGRGHQRLATFSLILGFVVMMVLDTTLG